MMARSGATVLGVMYVVLLGSHLVAVRTGFSAELSKDLLSFFFLVLMGSDAAAYYGGRAFGRHKLAPNVSPGKTWEGAVAGMLASLLLAAAAHYWFFRELPLKFALPLAAVMNVFGVLGDLTESALKRSAGAKDTAKFCRAMAACSIGSIACCSMRRSSTILPGVLPLIMTTKKIVLIVVGILACWRLWSCCLSAGSCGSRFSTIG